ncbi:MAG: cytosine permease [Bacteroidetes bacterium]|nr:cytosine permease [Bacteroidota bacterium]
MVEKKIAVLEDYGSTPVPEGQGKGWFGVGIVMWGVAVCLPAFLIAGLIAGPATLGTAIGAFLTSSLILGFIAILTGIIGAKTRLSTGLTIRFTFGKYGAYILQMVLFFASWGWFGVQLGFMAEGFGNGGLALVFGTAVPIWTIKVVGGILMTLTAMVGFKAIEKLTFVAIPLLLILIIATISSVYGNGVTIASVANTTAEGAMPFGVAVSVIVGSFIVGALIAPDITRYAKSKKAGGFGMAFGMVIGFPLVLILGGIMVKGSGGEFDFSRIMLSNNTGFWSFLAVVTIILAAWTTNDNNLYSGALSINAMFPKINKWVITVISGVVGIIFALIGINTSGGFQTFLGILTIVMPPAAGVLILDYFLFKNEENKGYNPTEISNVPNFRIFPCIAWIFGSGFGFIIKYTSLTFTTVTALDTMLIGAVFYFVIMIATKNKITIKQDA